MNKIKKIVLSYGFVIVLALLIVGLSIATERFLTVSNLLGVLHSSTPLIVVCCGICLVIMTGKIDISIGSTSFLSTAIAATLIVHYNVPPVVAFGGALVVGMLGGALIGFLVAYVRLNYLIASMGAMFIYRGIALQVVRSRVISMPDAVRNFGNLRIGNIYVDILIGIVILVLVHLVHVKTKFGRYVIAIGNSEDTAQKVGINTKKMTFLTFVLSGFFAALGGSLTVCQLGSVTLHMGSGLEFTAIGAIVIGGISLYGGEGKVIPGLFLGGITLILIENGLNHLGASPYLYPFVRGGIIFIAMFADSLKQNIIPEVKTNELDEGAA